MPKNSPSHYQRPNGQKAHRAISVMFKNVFKSLWIAASWAYSPMAIGDTPKWILSLACDIHLEWAFLSWSSLLSTYKRHPKLWKFRGPWPPKIAQLAILWFCQNTVLNSWHWLPFEEHTATGTPVVVEVSRLIFFCCCDDCFVVVVVNLDVCCFERLDFFSQISSKIWLNSSFSFNFLSILCNYLKQN